MNNHRGSFLKTHLKAGEVLLEEKRIGQILFSEGTYQIQVWDPEEESAFWPFLQLDDRGKLLDGFCTCKAAEKKGSCPHLAAAYLFIFQGKREPLHLRFRQSLWNQLCLMASHRHGYEPEVIKKIEGGYEATSTTGKRLFFIQSLNERGKRRLERILFQREVETEETSLKFSNLSAQELALWKQGRPTPHLRYELSFWSDLGKWWQILQEFNQHCTINFVYATTKEEPLPKWIEVRFEDVEVHFYIAQVNWPKIIPSLATVDSPLKVSELSYRTLDKITYNPQTKEILIDFKEGEKEPAVPQEEAIPVGEWLFVPNRGFYPAQMDPLFKEKNIPASRIASFLEKHPKVIQKYLVGTTLHLDEATPQYALHFDENLSLHIQCYLFEKGDLQKLNSAYFGHWAYIEDQGFYRLENPLFEGVEKIISKNSISDFVGKHRHWLQSFEGFQTHLSSLESHLAYSFTENKEIRFDTELEFIEEAGEEIHDFGEWIYVKGKGFYSKMGARTGTSLRAGMKVPFAQASRFIADHAEELEQVPHFFSHKTPLEKSGLHLSLNEKGRIVVKPHFTFKKGYTTDKVAFYGDYTYVSKEGFAEIPGELRLPEAYQKERTIEAVQEPYFVASELDLLAPFILSIDPPLQKPKHLQLKIQQIKKDPRATRGSWLIDLVYESEIGTVDAIEIWSGLNENRRYLFTSAGLIFLRSLRFSWLKNLPKKRFQKGGKRIRLTTLEWLKVSIFEEIKDPEGKTREERASLKVLEEFRTFQTHELIDLAGFESRLRPYQELGVRWLWFLYCQGLCGLLCDEMGLGKTHQAMGLLVAVLNAHQNLPPEERAKHIVICPTSVLYHWEDLLKRFLPHVRVAVFYGLGRTLDQEYDILLTSYGTLRSEKSALSKIRFEVAIFDEIQFAKNPASQTHRALRTIDATMRLGLTGTPIENRLLELKALFDLVVPSYFPTEALFKELFVNPIEKGQDPEKKKLLSRLIKPFILRRRKAEVLLELPEKIEEVAYCPLSEEQKTLYRDTFLAQREGLEKELADPSKPVPYLHVFALLTALKQICDHPCLLTKNIADYKKHASGKWDLFVQLVDETRDSGQKLVVFSQYLQMLDIIEAHLKEKKIGFAGIRGATRNRKEQLDKFRDDPKCEVFVASLQAAGVGVDLVSASVVIHYDRWWNPARENQATDRVHRMGQKRGVQVFKMVTRGTIEEHIHKLIEGKLSLMEVVGFDEHDQPKSLSRDELLHLLQEIHKEVREENEQNDAH